MGDDKAVTCWVCFRKMVSDKYTVRKGDGSIVKVYYCEHCCKVREVKDEHKQTDTSTERPS